MNWNVIRLGATGSTNDDAMHGAPGDVYVASVQTAGRGRLGHKWHAAQGESLAFSAVVGIAGMAAEECSTLPLAAGLACVKAASSLVPGAGIGLKWPNDVVCGGRKLCGILCERDAAKAVAGIGMNVLSMDFPAEIATRAVSLRMLGFRGGLEEAFEAVLDSLSSVLDAWKGGGLARLHPEIRAVDILRGRQVEVVQTDSGGGMTAGVSAGINPDGSLDVGGVRVWAGESHIAAL